MWVLLEFTQEFRASFELWQMEASGTTHGVGSGGVHLAPACRTRLRHMNAQRDDTMLPE